MVAIKNTVALASVAALSSAAALPEAHFGWGSPNPTKSWGHFPPSNGSFPTFSHGPKPTGWGHHSKPSFPTAWPSEWSFSWPTAFPTDWPSEWSAAFPTGWPTACPDFFPTLSSFTPTSTPFYSAPTEAAGAPSGESQFIYASEY